MSGRFHEKKIILCHVVTTLGFGGMENGIVNLANNLDRNKFEIVICCLNSAGAMAERLKDDVRLCVLHEGEGFSLTRILNVARFFRKLQPDIVHTHAWGGGSFYGILGAKMAKIPVVINGEHGSFFTKRYQVVLQRILFFLCNYNLSVSDTLKMKIQEVLNVPTEKITVIRNGVDTVKFNGCYPASEIFQALRDEGYEASSNSLNIFVVGSLKPQKSQITLLKSLKKIKEKNSGINVNEIKIIIIGSGPDREELQTFVQENDLTDNVYFLGNRNDVAELLTIADLLVSTSRARYEGLSNVLLEAMSSSVPVIATDSIGSKEIVTHGYNGYLIDEGDVQKLAHYINYLFCHRQKLAKMGQNARKTVLKNFSIDTMVSNYENIYFQAL